MDFKILTVATNCDHPIFKLLKSKLPLIVLDKTHFDWEGKKLTPYLLDFLNQFSDKDLILCVDGYDVLPLNGCTEEKLRKSILNFFNLEKITFNAETQCFPDPALAEQYPPLPSKWRFLNAGVMTGTVKNIKNILKKTIENEIDINQKSYTKLYLTTDLIDLDYKCQVFQTLLTGPYPDYPNIDMEDFIIENKTIINRTFKTKPLLFHGNGSVNLYPLLPYIKTISD